MRALNRMRGSLCGGHALEYRHHGWSMPRLAIESTAKLIADSIHFRHLVLFSNAEDSTK
jgi:hypothetical protein